MTGKECKNLCNCTDKDDSVNYMQTCGPVVTTYAAPFRDDSVTYPNPWTEVPPTYTITTSEIPTEHSPEDEYFEMVSEVEIRELVNDIFLWLSGMGEYPELLAQICPEEIVGDSDSNNDDERNKVSERSVVQVLRWVLGEL